MTKFEAAVISAYTGYMVGDFSDMQEYAEKLFNRPIFTHEFGNIVLVDKLREAAKPDLLKICEEIK